MIIGEIQAFTFQEEIYQDLEIINITLLGLLEKTTLAIYLL